MDMIPNDKGQFRSNRGGVEQSTHFFLTRTRVSRIVGLDRTRDKLTTSKYKIKRLSNLLSGGSM